MTDAPVSVMAMRVPATGAAPPQNVRNGRELIDGGDRRRVGLTHEVADLYGGLADRPLIGALMLQ